MSGWRLRPSGDGTAMKIASAARGPLVGGEARPCRERFGELDVVDVVDVGVAGVEVGDPRSATSKPMTSRPAREAVMASGRPT
jgi:hypothetical protein